MQVKVQYTPNSKAFHAELHVYDGLTALNRAVIDRSSRAPYSAHFASAYDNFASSTHWDTLRALSHGSDRYMASVNRLAIKAPVMTSLRKVKRKHHNRGRVNVVEAYRGNATPCRAKMPLAVDGAPASLVVDICVSAGTSDEAIERRGAAVLSLAAQLSVTRPVEIVILAGMRPTGGNQIVVMRFDAQSLPLRKLSWLLCSPAALRHVCFSHCESTNILWLNNAYEKQQKHLPRWVAGRLGIADSEAIFVPGVHLDNAGDFISDDKAAAWVQSWVDQAAEAA